VLVLWAFVYYFMIIANFGSWPKSVKSTITTATILASCVNLSMKITAPFFSNLTLPIRNVYSNIPHKLLKATTYKTSNKCISAYLYAYVSKCVCVCIAVAIIIICVHVFTWICSLQAKDASTFTKMMNLKMCARLQIQIQIQFHLDNLHIS